MTTTPRNSDATAGSDAIASTCGTVEIDVTGDGDVSAVTYEMLLAALCLSESSGDPAQWAVELDALGQGWDIGVAAFGSICPERAVNFTPREVETVVALARHLTAMQSAPVAERGHDVLTAPSRSEGVLTFQPLSNPSQLPRRRIITEYQHPEDPNRQTIGEVEIPVDGEIEHIDTVKEAAADSATRLATVDALIEPLYDELGFSRADRLASAVMALTCTVRSEAMARMVEAARNMLDYGMAVFVLPERPEDANT